MGYGLPPRGMSERQRRAWIGGYGDGETVGGNIVSGLANLGTPMLPDGAFFNPYSSRMQSRTSIGPNMMVAPERDHEFAKFQQKQRDAASGMIHDVALRGNAAPSNLPAQSSVDKKLGIPQPQQSPLQPLAGGKPYEEYWDYGQVEGPGGPRDDKAGVKRLPASGDLAALSNGEAVITAKAVESMNRDLFGGDPNGVEKYQLAVDPQAGANQTDRSERTAAVGGKDALKEFRTKNAQFFSGGKVMKMKKVRKCAGGSPLTALDDGYEALKYNVGEAIGPSIDAARSGLGKVGGAINRAAISALTSSPKTTAQPAAAQQPVLGGSTDTKKTGVYDTAADNMTKYQTATERRMAEAGLKGGKPVKKYKGGKKCAGGSPLLALGKSEPVRKLAGGTVVNRIAPTSVEEAMAKLAPQSAPQVIDRTAIPEIAPQPSRAAGARAFLNDPLAALTPKSWAGPLAKAGGYINKIPGAKTAGKLLRAPVVASAATLYDQVNTPVDDFYTRFGLNRPAADDNSYMDEAADVGVRALGAASDLGPGFASIIGMGDEAKEFLGYRDRVSQQDGEPTQPNIGTPVQPKQPAQNPVEQAIAARGAATSEQEQTVQQAVEAQRMKDAGIAQVGNTFVGGKYDPQAEAITAMRGRLRERENNMTNDVTSAYNAWKANPNMITEQRYRALSGQQNAIGDQNAMLGIQASAPGSILHQLLGIESGMDDGSGSGSGSGSGKDGNGGKNGGINQLSNAVNSAKANEREDTKLSADMSAKAVELAKEFGVDPNDVLQLWNTVGRSQEPGKDVAMAKLLAGVRKGVKQNKQGIAPNFSDPVFLNEVAKLSKQGRYGNLEDIPVFDAYDSGGLPAFFSAWGDKFSTNEQVLSKDRHIISADKNLPEDATALASYIEAQQKANAVK